MTSEVKTSSIEETVEDVCNCQICFEEFNPSRQPKFLPCSHTFCLFCLEKHAEAHSSLVAGTYFPCPICRTEVPFPANGLQSLPNNVYIGKVREVLEQHHTLTSPPSYTKHVREVCDICISEGQVKDAIIHCFDCQKKFCSECTEEHISTSGFGEHKMGDILRDQAKCYSHPQFDVSHYCRDHDSCVCIACTMKQHKSCSLTLVSAFIEEKKSSMESLLGKCKGKLDDVNAELNACTTKLQALNAEMVWWQQCMEITKADIRREESIKENLTKEAGELSEVVAYAEQSLLQTSGIEDTVTRLCPLEKSLETYFTEGTTLFVPALHILPNRKSTMDAAPLVEESPYECTGDLWLPDGVVYGNMTYDDCYGRKGSTVIFDVATSPDGHTAFTDVENRQIVIFDAERKATAVWRDLQNCHMVNTISAATPLPRLCSCLTWVTLDGVEGFAVVLLETDEKKNWLGVVTSSIKHHKLRVFSQHGVAKKNVILDNSAGLVSPCGLTVTKPWGHILVSDLDKNCIFFFDKEGHLMRTFGSFGTNDAQFDKPFYIASDEEALYVSDSGNNCVKMFALSGDFLGKIGNPKKRLNSTSGDSASSGEVCVQSLPINQDRKPDIELRSPGCVCMFRDMMVVCDTGNNKVKLFSKTGEMVQVLAVLESPRGVSPTSEGNLVISYGKAYSARHGIKIFSIPQWHDCQEEVPSATEI